jgi:hypothetical protein
MKFIRLFWEIPLSICSWLYFHEMKFILGRLYTFGLSRMQSEAHEWKVFSREIVSRPFVLPIIATKGPRWNTHAVIFTAGPLDVIATLSFEVATAAASASSWSIVIYANPGYKTVTSIESFDVPSGEQWHRLKLAPGKYSINARYYGLSDPAFAPSVRADDAEVVPASPVARGSNDFYQDLRRRDSRFYAALHYYVFHMLRFRRFLPDAFVQREFLPAGDPGTIFRYGIIRAGECLEVESRTELLANYDLYLTVYNRSSFPAAWETIRETQCRTQPAAADGYYLFRIRRKPSIAEQYREEWMSIRTTPAGDGSLYRSASSGRR